MERVELFNDHEEWREIPEYNNYEVSNLGRVRSKNRIINQFWRKQNYDRIMKGKILKPRKQNGGYLLVCLCKDGKRKAYTVLCIKQKKMALSCINCLNLGKSRKNMTEWIIR